jgi:hypothetical protein
LDTNLLCAPSQRTHTQTVNYPRLEVSPGSYVAIKYLENGHVTFPGTQPGKPSGAGVVRVFGTNQPNTQELLIEVLKWTTDGSGDDGRGRLLTVQNFDDGRCYQINDSEISVLRQREFPNPVSGIPGSSHEQCCVTDIMVPEDVPAGSLYTIYWVWQWPTKAGVPGPPHGKDEYYTTCSDLVVVIGPTKDGPLSPLPGQDPQTFAVENFQSRAASKADASSAYTSTELYTLLPSQASK